MLVVRKLACGVMCFAAMIASATTTTNFDFFVEYIQSSGTQWMDTGVQAASSARERVPATSPKDWAFGSAANTSSP